MIALRQGLESTCHAILRRLVAGEIKPSDTPDELFDALADWIGCTRDELEQSLESQGTTHDR